MRVLSSQPFLELLLPPEEVRRLILEQFLVSVLICLRVELAIVIAFSRNTHHPSLLAPDTMPSKPFDDILLAIVADLGQH